MATYNVGPHRETLLGDVATLGLLPPELLHIVQHNSSPRFLDTIAEAALIPQLTGRLYAHFEAVFADICARWLHNSIPGEQDDRIIASFARILPFSPHLSVLLDKYLVDTAGGTRAESQEPTIRSLRVDDPKSLPDEASLLRTLMSLWRLLSFDRQAYASAVPDYLQHLFQYPASAVRYLAIRIYCQSYSAADGKLEQLLLAFTKPEEALLADFDGTTADFTFLSLYEHKRAEEIHSHRIEIQERRKGSTDQPEFPHRLSPLVAAWGKTVLPRPLGPSGAVTSLVQTATTLTNLENTAAKLQQQEPILLRGLPGSGKTSVVLELARELGKAAGLVSLHLNEQTDAKMLVGIYTTATKPGQFEWRPGVLTTAVREGRWLLIEDLDRAPNEVLSTILPLIERRELLIPNRSESIKAPRDFRIFATVRTTVGMHGQETGRTLLGERFWQAVNIQPLPETELHSLLRHSFPPLANLLPDITSAFDQMTALSGNPSRGLLGRSASDRPVSVRDLLKWCRRLERILLSGKAQPKGGVLNETAWTSIFLDAFDCFVGNVKDDRERYAMAQRLGQALRMSAEAVSHALEARVPQLVDGESQLVAGRAGLPKVRRSRWVSNPSRPFAPTAHARRLLEQISMAVAATEPVLLVGETGIGKTAVVQQLADLLGHRLVAINLSQQSEVGDLLGGFKPVSVRSLAMPLKEEFEDLFAATEISTKSNQKYLQKIGACMAKGRWKDVAKLWQQAPKIFEQILDQLTEKQATNSTEQSNGDQPLKRRKTRLQVLSGLQPRWDAFSRNLEQFEIQISGGEGKFAFSFVEGKLVKAVRNGSWVLLDEINLATADTLESIADLLNSGPHDTPSILLSEKGEIERIEAHPNFRVFGAMNPATDVGKRDLPIGLRSRFTELYITSPDKDPKDLAQIVTMYLKGNNANIRQAADRVVTLYQAIKALADEKSLVDGANDVPHFSLRSLTRVLAYVNEVAPFYGLERALYEGFCMGFLTLLSQQSEDKVMPLILGHLFGDGLNRRQSSLSQPPRYPGDGRTYVRFMNKDKDRQYWLLRGLQTPQERTDYIRTPYVERNLLNLVRATSTRLFPILIQGPTSSGKTSMIEYLAEFSGNKFVRINNHEHTDLQEYLGTYVSGPDGKLKFQEGALVQAMRLGHWIVLDELNLAPTDVLEALNRLLDDNRELLIPETQEIVRPHDSFMLFATQNPPGIYGGRKVLSRAFRNRFLELHFDDIPESELRHILQQRCIHTAPSDCERIVTVYKDLSRLRQSSRMFEQKNSFATLRDLFRWALRDADNREQIADNGYMLLAERVRDDEERVAVKEIIETVFKVKISPDALYDAQFSSEMAASRGQTNSQGVVWTKAMRRLYVLVAQALRNNEPVLLVGETGCGKTTVCQLLAETAGKELHIVNAHQNTETGDLIGSQRPVRNRGAALELLRQALLQAMEYLDCPADGAVEDLQIRYRSLPSDVVSRLPVGLAESIVQHQTRSQALFEWCDGSLVHAMKSGQYFLLDEISLAEDSVLERLNSVLEPQRTLLLAEKGVEDPTVQAIGGFQFLATMNPGGDFGKKELSPALRNRFTEIWVPPLSESEDILQIVVDKLRPDLEPLATIMVEFSHWFGRTFRSSSTTPFSIRDILVWVKFLNHCDQLSPETALVHGAATVFIDTLGANPSAMISVDPKTMGEQRQKCLDKLSALLGHGFDASVIYTTEPVLEIEGSRLRAGDFGIPRSSSANLDKSFEFEAPTTKRNAMRVVRALQLDKPILLEGNPGVGKTTLISALARASGHHLTRINLSDQTDLMDLFGTDVPVEGEAAGTFAWRDAPLLQSMQSGGWVLLDEMNLASQSVLEGLNACLDHRGEVYIAELDQVFKRHPDFRLFAAQNPHHQGGGRKGLPSSFVNRFIVVYADVFTVDDQMRIAAKRSVGVTPEMVRRIINFISNLDEEVVGRKAFGSQGSPWEFNLRDTLRWLELAGSAKPFLGSAEVKDSLDIIIRQRFRTKHDRNEVTRIFRRWFDVPFEDHSLYHSTDSAMAQVGLALLERDGASQPTPFPGFNERFRLAELESLIICVQQNLPCILCGPSGSGKSAILQHLAALAGKKLVVFSLNADIDTLDLVGGFEQADPVRKVHAHLNDLREVLGSYILERDPQTVIFQEAVELMRLLRSYSGGPGQPSLIATTIEALAPKIPSDSTLSTVMQSTNDLLRQPTILDNPRFEWLDGVIVRAIQTGQWLVLDNANLCSASVLDRLNSLLERPDGFLSINEDSGPDGGPRIVKPSPGFRVFLTMDPKHGELSRAMRNRSVEIYMELPETSVEPFIPRITPIEASMKRYHTVAKVSSVLRDHSGSDYLSLALDTLVLGDATYLRGFAENEEIGLLGGLPQGPRQNVDALLSYINSQDASHIRTAISRRYGALAGVIDALERDGRQEGAPWDALVRMQPLHPLQNAPVERLLAAQPGASFRSLGICYEAYFELFKAHQAIAVQRQSASLSKPSSLNRLQRSCISHQVAVVSGDSTVKVAHFLTSVLHAVNEFLRPHVEGERAIELDSLFLREVLHFWWRTFSSVVGPGFDEVGFQAHLTQAIALLKERTSAKHAAEDRALGVAVLRQLDDSFVAGFKRSTGLSVEVLWQLWSPFPVGNIRMLEQAVAMETLALRFDNLRWRTSSSASDLGHVMSSLAQAYSVLRAGPVDATDLLVGLTQEIQTLESSSGELSMDLPPVLAKEFDSLRQVLVLHGHAGSLTDLFDILVLSDLPTKAWMRLQCTRGAGNKLQAVDYLLSQGTEASPWTGTLTATLLEKYESISSSSLQSLLTVQSELPRMGQMLAKSTEAIISDPLAKLNQMVWELLLDVAAAHDSALGIHLVSLFESVLRQRENPSIKITPYGLVVEHLEISSMPSPSCPEHLAKVLKDNFTAVVIALAASKREKSSRSLTAIAWVQFAIGCVKLYTPDKVFDPYLKSQMALEFHETLQASLQRKMSGLYEFEDLLTGRRVSSRAKLVEQDLVALGEGPKDTTAHVYRPASSGLLKVQKELFNPVLDVVLKDNMSSTHYSLLSPSGWAEEQLQVMKDNVLRLIDRLSGQFTAYQDLTMPLVNLLRCLQLGLSLTYAPASEVNPLGGVAATTAGTPFLGGSLTEVEGFPVAASPFEFLSFSGICSSIDGTTSLSLDGRTAVCKCFHLLYEEWSRKLEADRKAEEAKASLYRYRGSAEDEEELDEAEFRDLFPDYTDEGEDNKREPISSRHTPRDLSWRVAKAHKEILQSPRQPLEALHDFCQTVGRKVARDATESSGAGIDRDATLLPAAVFILEERLRLFKSDRVESRYNFYGDPNLPECRKLVSLVNEIRLRFRRLQQIDEIGHLQPLGDVVTACEKVLELGQSEPLARVLPRVEKLHEFVYEWNTRGYASKQHTAPVLYDRLTTTIVGWRKAELSTWNKLFDMEVRKCEEETGSWWFIAYQAVIAGPLAMVESSQDLEAHSTQLLQELGNYLGNSMVGQFSARLDLLRQLQLHLGLLVLEYPLLTVVLHGLQNFISFYGRYEPKIQGLVQKGREGLQKKMNDILLLASWKDTNIVALRESARKSHQKLFRLVRKFRAVLGQLSGPIVAQALPDLELVTTNTASPASAVSLDIDLGAGKTCQRLIPGWGEDAPSRRLLDVEKIVKIMGKTGKASFEAPAILDSFLADLLSSIASLRKETPGVLTEENKAQVKYLKNRKVKLYSETLKSIRQMGFTRNLGVSRLAVQNSSAVIFSRLGATKDVPGLDTASSDYYFYKAVDMAPRFRAALFNHHSDLHLDTARRSTGYLEGILSVLLQQRDTLAKATRELEQLDRVIIYVEHLGSNETGEALGPERWSSNHERVLRWLVQILGLGLRLIDAHASLGALENQLVRSQLQSWRDRMAALSTQYEATSALPEGFTSTRKVELRTRTDKDLEALREYLSAAVDRQPSLGFVFQQLQLWTSVSFSEVQDDRRADGLARLTAAMLDTSGKILDAIQRFSKAAATLPTSDENVSWLVQYGTGMANAVKSLHIHTIADDLAAWVRQLRSVDLDDAQQREAASALFRVLRPILQQYTAICHNSTRRLMDLHESTSKLGYHLSKAFTDLASNGFCTPQEKSDDKSGETGDLESGTGLGDGEGAEDISKDVQPEEDLSELAQEANKDRDGDMEDEKEAVDMGEDDLEGEMGSVAGADDDEEGSGSGEDDEKDDEMDEETGDVDDLDPTAVDEKMWDGDEQEEAEKDQQGNKAKGQKKDDDLAAVDDMAEADNDSTQEDDEADIEDVGPEQEEALPEDELNRQDQHVPQDEALALPDDMEIDGKSATSSDSDDDLDDASEAEQEAGEGEAKENDAESDGEAEEGLQPKDAMSDVADDEVDADTQAESNMELDGDDEEQDADEGHQDEESAVPETRNDNDAQVDDVVPSDARSGGGQTQDEADAPDEERSTEDKAQREDGQMIDEPADQDSVPGSKGGASGADGQPPQPDREQGPDSQVPQPFKELGDLLEKWYRNQKEIQAADPETQDQPQPDEAESGLKEFQHLQDENAKADDQALGTADDGEARPLDDAMAIDDEMEAGREHLLENQDEAEHDVDKMDTDAAETEESKPEQKDDRSGVSTRQGAYHRGDEDEDEDHGSRGSEDKTEADEEQDVEETSAQLSVTRITGEDGLLRDFSEALEEWTTFQIKTHSLSLSLTSQLRLILTPSQSTKLSGAFRTGKRLNIKKIIPYIASSYKRDKIWMRRAVPAKRTYQILLCVDDSESMGGDSASGRLALESLVMVARALALLEAGQVGVLSFGDAVAAAHDLAEPFASPEAGARALQHFTFTQRRTDVALLLRHTIDRFRLARATQPPGGGGADLWQLALVLSDGVTPSSAHEPIRRLLREAHEARVMVVFIVLDDAARERRGNSVLELKEARFVKDPATGESNVVVSRYLDTFPFPYYLIVHHLQDLPNALAGLLRTWFAEVSA